MDNTWSQYVRMDEPALEPGRIESALDALNWEDDFELGEPWEGEEFAEE